MSERRWSQLRDRAGGASRSRRRSAQQRPGLSSRAPRCPPPAAPTRGACAAPRGPGGSRRAAPAPSGCAPARRRRSCSGGAPPPSTEPSPHRSRHWRRTPRGPLILIVEAARVADAIKRDNHTERFPRKSRGAIRARPAPRLEIRPCEPSEQHLLRGLVGGDPVFCDVGVQAVGDRGRCRDDEILTLAEHDDQSPGLDQRPPPLHDRVEHPVEVRLAANRDGDVGGRLQPPDRTAKVVAIPSAVGDVRLPPEPSSPGQSRPSRARSHTETRCRPCAWHRDRARPPSGGCAEPRSTGRGGRRDLHGRPRAPASRPARRSARPARSRTQPGFAN